MLEFIYTLPLIGTLLEFIIPAIVILSLVIAIHEYGHYIVGRLCGIHAEVFSIGFGKKLFSYTDKHGTQWQVAAIPLGGYVKFLGDMDATSTSSQINLAKLSPQEATRRFCGASLIRRSLTVLAGPGANFLFSFFIFTALAITYGKTSEEPIIGDIISADDSIYSIQLGDKIVGVEDIAIENFADLLEWSRNVKAKSKTNYQVERDGKILSVQGPFPSPAYIVNVFPVTAASKAGLKSGDLIISLNGTEINSFKHLQEVVATAELITMPIVILRDGAKLTLTITPRLQEIENEDSIFEQKKLLGISGGFAFTQKTEPRTFLQACTVGALATINVIKQSIRGIYLMVMGQLSPKNLQGPVGIAHMASDVSKTGWLNLIYLLGTISTAIGFLNLLPLPVLDGGHLLQFAYQGIFGKPINDKTLRIATVISLSLLLTLMFYVTFNDLIRFFA